MRTDLLPPLALCFASTAALAAVLGAGSSDAVLVVFSSTTEPYNEAVDGIRRGLEGAGRSPSLVDLKTAPGPAALAELLRRSAPRLIIAVGSEAWNVVALYGADVPLLATMMLRSEPGRAGSSGSTAQLRVSAVNLDVPISSIAAELAGLFPGKTRLGLIRNPSRDPGTEPHGPARLQGFTLQVAECSHPQELLRAFRSLRGKVDFVLVSPDSSLYNQATVKPLILDSLENSLPIVGFSSSFVRAGAAVGIYPDFQDIGQQTAEVALALLAGKATRAQQSPRKLQVAVNQRVMRLCGLEPAESRLRRLVVYR